MGQVRIVQIFFTAGFEYSGQPRRCQNIFQPGLHKRHDSLFISLTGLQRILNWP